MQQKRLVLSLLALLLSLCSLISLSGISVYAASDDGNLVSDDLNDWTVMEGGSNINIVEDSSYNGAQRLRFGALDMGPNQENTQEVWLVMGALLDNPAIIAGHNYTFSMLFPSILDPTDRSRYCSHFPGCEITIGFTYLTPEGSLDMDSSSYVNFASFDFDTFMSNYHGKSLTCNFTCPNGTGTPCIFIFAQGVKTTSLNSFGPTNSFLLVDDIKLLDSELATQEKLDGITGFLHNIYWDMFGGQCDNLDCPHSVASNPHESLSQRIKTSLTSLFNTITTRLTQLQTNMRNWFTNLTDSLSDLGDNIQQWFINLGESLVEGIKSLFIPEPGFFTNYAISFENLLKNNLGFIYEAGDFLSDFIDVIAYLLSDSQGQDLLLEFDGVEFEIDGHNVDLFSHFSVDFSFLQNGAFAVLYGIYKVILYVIFGFCLIQYAMKTWERVMAN